MSWALWVPILNLVCILIELCDPTTAFIRVAPEEYQHRPSLVAIANMEDESQDDASDVQDDRPVRKNTSTNTTQIEQTQSHAALAIRMIIVHVQPAEIPKDRANTGLIDQYDPPTLKRPPIAPAVFRG